MARAPVLTLLLAAGCLPSNFFPIHGTHSEGDESSSTDETASSSSSSSGDSSSDGGESASGSSSSTTEASSTSTSSTTSVPDTTGGSTTDEPPEEEFPLCGNGKIDGKEECDDALDMDDTCDGCKRLRFAFVTDLPYGADEINGLEHADELCRQAAGDLPLPNWKGYKAWLSDSKTSVRDRLHHGLGPYARVDRVVIAESFEDLIDGELLAPIDRDQYGNPLMFAVAVWTGTRPDGTAVPGATHCKDWTDDGLTDFSAYVGLSSETNEMWTIDTDPETSPAPCIFASHLYCFEDK